MSRLFHSCWPVSILFLAHSNQKRYVCPVFIDRPVSSQLRESLYQGRASSLTRLNQEADIQGKAFHISRPQQGEVTSLSRSYRSTDCFRIHSKGKPLVGKRAYRGRKKAKKKKRRKKKKRKKKREKKKRRSWGGGGGGGGERYIDQVGFHANKNWMKSIPTLQQRSPNTLLLRLVLTGSVAA